MINFLRRHYVVMIVIVLLLLGSFAFLRPDKAPAYEFVVAEARDLAQVVSAVGRVKPLESVGLTFNLSGKIIKKEASISILLSLE